MTDIEKIRRILQSRKQSYLADLLAYSEGEILESSTYGNYLFSTLSTYYIKSSPEQTDKLNSLNESDRHHIYEAVLAVYPHKDHAPEITNVEFLVSFDETFYQANVETEKLKNFSVEIVHEQLQKCSRRIDENDLDGAVTMARSFLESLCKYILNSRDVIYKENDKLPNLYKLVSKELKMNPGLYKETPAFRDVLSGFVSIVNGIASIRNEYSDSHGVNPQKTYKIDRRHAILTVNAAKTVADYLLENFEK